MNIIILSYVDDVELEMNDGEVRRRMKLVRTNSEMFEINHLIQTWLMCEDSQMKLCRPVN